MPRRRACQGREQAGPPHRRYSYPETANTAAVDAAGGRIPLCPLASPHHDIRVLSVRFLCSPFGRNLAATRMFPAAQDERRPFLACVSHRGKGVLSCERANLALAPPRL
ncbi:hypothetical protein MRX96_046479 [Rhipicephalus microplus]